MPWVIRHANISSVVMYGTVQTPLATWSIALLKNLNGTVKFLLMR